jgi:ABC-2 type transport system permease protein
MNIVRHFESSTFWPMLWKEFTQLRRDRLTFAMMTVLPAVQLALFGYAIRTEVRHLPTVVLDQSLSRESRELLSVITNTGNFDIVGRVSSRAELAEQIGRGRASAAVVIPPDYATNVKRHRQATAQVIVDAADPLSSQAALSGASLAGAVQSARLARPGASPPLDVRVRPWYNPTSDSATYIVPGIIGILLSLTLILIMSMAVVRERERGTLEQLIVTPISKASLMFGKITPFVIVGYVQMTVVIVLGALLFSVPVRGSLPLLYLLSFAFIVANLGIGLLISTVTRTQTQAMQLGFFFLLPNILLSGFMFPREAMPRIAQWLGLTLPLTYYLNVVRGVLLKGSGLAYLWRDSLILVLFAAAMMAVSVRRFSKRIG